MLVVGTIDGLGMLARDTIREMGLGMLATDTMREMFFYVIIIYKLIKLEHLISVWILYYNIYKYQ